jgi:hypothetical protein
MASTRSKALRNHFSHSGSKLRPILTNLNGDNSWLISFPIPEQERQKANGKAYFHIVSDPWLTGPAWTLSSYAMHFTLPHSPAAKSGSDVEAMAYEIEELAQEEAGHALEAPVRRDSVIDAISISHQNDDHKHNDTLKTFRANIPVVAAPTPAAAIRNLNHFETVVDSLDLAADTQFMQSLHPGSSVLPPWLNIFRLPASMVNYATAFVWSHPDNGTTKHEIILAAPHGIKAQEPSVQKFISILDQDQDTMVLTLLHGMKANYTLLGQHTFGAVGGLALERPLKPKYWVATGDAKLLYGGIILRLLRTYDVFETVDYGLEKEAEKNGGVQGRRPNYLETDNGDCLVLE